MGVIERHGEGQDQSQEQRRMNTSPRRKGAHNPPTQVAHLHEPTKAGNTERHDQEPKNSQAKETKGRQRKERGPAAKRTQEEAIVFSNFTNFQLFHNFVYVDGHTA